MTLPHTFVGGTQATAGEVNANFEAVHVRRKKFTDATLRLAHLGGGFANSGTSFTFTAPAGSFIIGLRFKVDARAPASTGEGVSLQFTGTNLGTVYLSRLQFIKLAANSDSTMPHLSGTEGGIFGFQSGLFQTFGVMTFAPLHIQDASTTINVRTSNNVEIQNAELDIVYVEAFNEG